MMMNTQIKLNLEDEVREFVGDFKKFFEELKEWTEDAVQIKTSREFFKKVSQDGARFKFWGVAGSEDFACSTLPTTPYDFQGKV